MVFFSFYCSFDLFLGVTTYSRFLFFRSTSHRSVFLGFAFFSVSGRRQGKGMDERGVVVGGTGSDYGCS